MPGSIDRRQERRYPLRMNVTYAPASRRLRHVRPGTGYTLDISRRAVLFEADQPLPVGAKLTVSIDLPSSDKTPDRRLSVDGSVIRVSGRCVAVRFIAYRFTPNAIRANEETTTVKTKPVARALVCISNDEDAQIIMDILEHRSFQVLRGEYAGAAALAVMPEADIRLIVTDCIDGFSGLALPILWVNAPEDAAELPSEPNVTILEKDYPVRKLLRAVTEIITSSKAVSA